MSSFMDKTLNQPKRRNQKLTLSLMPTIFPECNQQHERENGSKTNKDSGKNPSVFFNKENTPKGRRVQWAPISEVNYDRKVTDLYEAIESKDWESALQFIRDSPSDASTWIYRNERDGSKLRWRLLPIHAAIIFRAPIEVIRELLDAYPDGASAVDDQGMTPLHLAFRYGSRDEVVYELLHTCPSAIDMADRKGRIPINLHNMASAADIFTSSTLPKTPKSFNNSYTLTPKNKRQQSGFATYVSLAVESERRQVMEELKEEYDMKIKLMEDEHDKKISALPPSHDANEEIEDIKFELQELKEAYDFKEDEAKNLQEENIIMKEKVEQLEATLASFDSTEQVDNELLRSMVETERELKEHLAQKEAEVDSLWNLIETLESENSKLSANVQEMENTNNAFENQVNSLKLADEELKSAMSATERELTKFVTAKEAETVRLKEKNGFLKKKNDALKKKIAELEKSLSSSRDEVASTKEHAAETEKETAELKKKFAEYQVKFEREQRMKVILTEKERELTGKVVEIEKTLATKDDELVLSKEHVASMERETEVFQKKIDTLLIEYQLKCDKEQKLKATLSEIEIELKDAMVAKELETSSFYEDKKEMSRNMNKYEKEIQQLGDSLSDSMGQLSELQNENHMLSAERNRLASDTRDLSTKNLKLNAEIHRLNEKVQSLSHSLMAVAEEQNSIIDAASKQEHELKSSVAARELMMAAMVDQMNEAQAAADTKQKLIVQTARKQKETMNIWN